MNAERLHALALEIQKELVQTNQVNLVNQLIQHLQNQVNQPNQPQHQQNVSNTLKTLFSNLKSASSNNFPPTWKQIIQEVGARDLLGVNLLEKIEEIFSRNQITPSIALTELQKIQKTLQSFHNAINNLIASFKVLNIGADELMDGECELGILIPRKYVDNQLKHFGEELEELNKILGVFAEIATGSRPGFEIRQISSTDLTVFLDIVPQIGACLALAIERIVALYKNLLEIRKLHNELKQRVPEENLEGIEKYANSFMADAIEKIVPEIIEKFYKSQDDQRKNELSNELLVSLKRIANRIDRSFNFEIRVKPPEKESEEESDEATQEYFKIIVDSTKELIFLKEEGEPILSLPEPNNDEQEKNK